MSIDVMEFVRDACVKAGITLAELARRVGWTKQNMNRRLTTGKLSTDEWERLADALGGKFSLKITVRKKLADAKARILDD